MSKLLETIERIQDTQAAIKRLEEAAAKHPDVPSVAASLRSLQKRQRVLETTFSSLADEQWLDVCSYKILPEKEEGSLKLPSLTSALGDFQTLFTLVYDAIKHGAKQHGRATAEAAAATTFSFGYSFTGSVGFVLTLPNERLLTDETDLDRAMSTVFEMAKAENSEQIASFAKEL